MRASRAIDVTAAEKLDGVKAIVTARRFSGAIGCRVRSTGEGSANYHYMTRNVMAREKVLYEGHAVAAVAATSDAIAKQALKLIKVDYEVLPHRHSTSSRRWSRTRRLLHDDAQTAASKPEPATASNIASPRRVRARRSGEAGFKAADHIIERTFTTETVHQGYIEPHACIASVSEDGQC